MSSLSQEQKERIEENKRKALQLRARRLQEQQSQTSTPAPHHSSRAFYNRPPASSNSFRSNGGPNRENLSPVAITGSLVLIPKERFALVMPYHQQTINAVKEIAGREYGEVNQFGLKTSHMCAVETFCFGFSKQSLFYFRHAK